MVLQGLFLFFIKKVIIHAYKTKKISQFPRLDSSVCIFIFTIFMYMATYLAYIYINIHSIFNTHRLIVNVEKFIILNPQILPPHFPSVSYRCSLKMDWGPGFSSLLINTGTIVLRQLASGCILVFLNIENQALDLTKLNGRCPKQGLILL